MKPKCCIFLGPEHSNSNEPLKERNGKSTVRNGKLARPRSPWACGYSPVDSNGVRSPWAPEPLGVLQQRGTRRSTEIFFYFSERAHPASLPFLTVIFFYFSDRAHPASIPFLTVIFFYFSGRNERKVPEATMQQKVPNATKRPNPSKGHEAYVMQRKIPAAIMQRRYTMQQMLRNGRILLRGSLYGTRIVPDATKGT